MTTTPTPDRIHTSRSQRLIAYLAAVAFAIAALWSLLVAEHLTVAAPPGPPAPGEPLDAAMHRGYAWFVTTLPQERFNTSIAIVGMLCLVAVGAFLGDRMGRLPGYAVGLGAVFWSVGNILNLGGHRAVGMMATHDNPIEAVNSINFTVDVITETFEAAGFTLLGCGVLAFAVLAIRQHAATRAWAASTAVLGAAMLLLAVAYATGNGDLVTWTQGVGGFVLLPAWLLWTGRRHLAGDTHSGQPAPGTVAGAVAAGAATA